METSKIIGLMSGTSLDGLDIAYIFFQKDAKNHWNFDLKESKTIAYPDEISELLQQAIDLNAQQLFGLDVQLGEFMGKAVDSFCTEFSIDRTEIDAIASHGHTVFHQPDKRFSIQIGSGTAIAVETGIPVISNFRSKDVYLGGQGAPLVPIGDFHLFRNKAEAFLNIGGITNVSFLKDGKMNAFDICPGNLPLNKLAHNKALKYDPNGDLARSGDLNFFLLDLLNDLAYYQIEGPKSLGVEWLEQAFYPLIKFDREIENNLRTVVEHLAIQVGNVLNRENLKTVLITGGGAHNSFLIERIQHYFQGEIRIPSKEILEFKEAIIFGFLGALYLAKEPTSLSSVTGAQYDSIGGIFHLP